MFDHHALADAGKRLSADLGLVERQTAECRRIANFARDHHPAGYGHVDAIVNDGLRAAGFHDGRTAQLLQVELTLARLKVVEGEANVELARRRAVDDALAARRTAEARSGFNIGQQHRDNAILDAARTLGHRLQHLNVGELSGRLSEADFLAGLDSLERDTRAFITSIGASRRAARLRVSAEAARQLASQRQAA